MQSFAPHWLALILFVTISWQPALAQKEIPLWDGDMPGAKADEQESMKMIEKKRDIHVTNVSEPTMTLFMVESEAPTPFVVVCPGGGYRILSFTKEGIEIAQWLNSIGVSAGVLKYRVPDNREGALADASQAIRTVREKAKQWNVDGDRVGMLGFSAGGHLTAACSNGSDRPNFSVLVYPAYLDSNGGIDLTPEVEVDAKSPPAFIVQTQDDRKYYRSTLAYAAALDSQNVPAEVHLFAKGGHGYGMRPGDHPVSKWPAMCKAWMQESGFLEK